MALRAYIQSVEFPSEDQAQVVAVVTDDVRKKEVYLTVSSLDDLIQRLRVVLQSVDNVTALKDVLHPNAVIDLTPVVKDPTQEQIDQQAFLLAYAAYQSGFRKIQCGLLKADDADVADLLVIASAAYKAKYAGIG